nr:hypothetical protein [Providencia rettgeri]
MENNHWLFGFMDYHDSNDGNFAFHYPKRKKIEPHFGGAFRVIEVYMLDEFEWSDEHPDF